MKVGALTSKEVGYNDIDICNMHRWYYIMCESLIMCIDVKCKHGHICHRHGNWVKEKMERFGCIYSIKGFWCGCRVVFLLEEPSRQL